MPAGSDILISDDRDIVPERGEDHRSVYPPPMRPTRLRLRYGNPPDRMIEVINDLVAECDRLTSWMQRGNVELAREKYLEWVETVESQLALASADPEALQALRTDRYWHIRTLTSGSPRPYPLINAERDEQAATLRAWAAELQERRQRLADTSGQILVLDTNVLLEFLPPDQVPWSEIAGCDSVRLVIPLRVVEELDMKKYSNSPRLADRARALLPRLESLIGAAGQPGPLRSADTIEVLVEPYLRFRPVDADEEILSVCLELQQYGGGTPRLLTADTAMRLRAAGLGIDVLSMPEAYRRPAPKPSKQVADAAS